MIHTSLRAAAGLACVPQDGPANCLAELQQQQLQCAKLRAANAKLVDRCAAAELSSVAKSRQQEAALHQARQVTISDGSWPAQVLAWWLRTSQ